MALRLPISRFEAPRILLNRIPSRSLPPLSALVRAPPPRICRRKLPFMLAAIGKEDTEVRVSGGGMEDEEGAERSGASGEAVVEVKEEMSESVYGELDDDVSPEVLESVGQIKRVLDILKKKRDMLFGEVKLTIMIEDPRDVERKRLLGIEDPDEVTRDDLAAALEDIHEGRIPTNRVALRLLAEEMINWPELEVETPKRRRNKSLYARVTDTGVDPREAAKRLNIDWDSAADIEAEDVDDDIEVPPAVRSIQKDCLAYTQVTVSNAGIWRSILGDCFASHYWSFCCTGSVL